MHITSMQRRPFHPMVYLNKHNLNFRLTGIGLLITQGHSKIAMQL